MIEKLNTLKILERSDKFTKNLESIDENQSVTEATG